MGTLIHYQPDPNNENVRCLDGFTKVRKTIDIKLVTCPMCLDFTNNRFWVINKIK